jgi:hypothetical protein
MKERLIHHVIAMWDECDHVSKKRSSYLSKLFWAGYLRSFPEGNKTSESPTVVVSDSPMFDLKRVRSFFHEGSMITYKGKNKDLAIAKFCTSGFIDQDEHYHFIVDGLRAMRYLNGDPPMQADTAVLVAFITSDTASGMKSAIEYVMHRQESHRVNFACLQTAKHLSTGDQRMANAGYLLGKEFKQRFVCIQEGAILLNLES